MGEKPMGASPEVDETDPGSAGAAMKAMPAPIKQAGAVVTPGAEGAAGDAPPGMAAGTIITTGDNIPRHPQAAGMAGDPIPGIDTDVPPKKSTT